MEAALWLILATSLVRIKQIDTISLNTSSGCYLERQQQRFPCVNFHEVSKSEVESLFYVNETNAINITSPEIPDKRVNVSTKYPSDFHDIRMYLLVYIGSDKKTLHSVWRAGKQDGNVSGPFGEWYIHFYNIPVPDTQVDSFSVEVLRAYNSHSLPESACSKAEIQTQCSSLNSSETYIRHIAKSKTVVLTIASNLTSNLKVTLLHGSCEINCSQGISQCNISTKEYKWRNTSKELIMGTLDGPSYYCARITFEENDCCTACTMTYHFTGDEEFKELITISERTPAKAFYIMTVVILSILCITGVVVRLREAFKKVCWHYSLGNQNMEVIIQTDPDTFEGRNDTELNDNTEILLLYYNESEEFISVIDNFRALLNAYGVKVWDPLSDDQIEEVRSNPYLWLEEKLKESRIILVETENAIQTYKERLKCPKRGFFQDQSLYFYALTLLQCTKSTLDYKNTYVVRFDYRMEQDSLLQLVPCTRYTIPSLFPKLISDISMVIRKPDKWELDDIMIDLKESIKKYQKVKNEKIDI